MNSDVLGCLITSLAACRQRRLSPPPPRSLSPTIGWPIDAQCILNWFVRPVTGSNSNNVLFLKRFITVNLDSDALPPSFSDQNFNSEWRPISPVIFPSF